MSTKGKLIVTIIFAIWLGVLYFLFEKIIPTGLWGPRQFFIEEVVELGDPQNIMGEKTVPDTLNQYWTICYKEPLRAKRNIAYIPSNYESADTVTYFEYIHFRGDRFQTKAEAEKFLLYMMQNPDKFKKYKKR